MSDVKLCACGCGTPTPRANRIHRGYKVGEQQRYIHNHHQKEPADLMLCSLEHLRRYVKQRHARPRQNWNWRILPTRKAIEKRLRELDELETMRAVLAMREKGMPVVLPEQKSPQELIEEARAEMLEDIADIADLLELPSAE